MEHEASDIMQQNHSYSFRNRGVSTCTKQDVGVQRARESIFNNMFFVVNVKSNMLLQYSPHHHFIMVQQEQKEWMKNWRLEAVNCLVYRDSRRN